MTVRADLAFPDAKLVMMRLLLAIGVLAQEIRPTS